MITAVTIASIEPGRVAGETEFEDPWSLEADGIECSPMPPGDAGRVFWEFQNTGCAAPLVIAKLEG